MSKRARYILLAMILLLLALLSLLLPRCSRKVAAPTVASTLAAPVSAAPAAVATAAPAPVIAAEDLTPATLQAPASVVAGAKFEIHYTGPNNPRDYVTLVRPDAAATSTGNYVETHSGDKLELAAPVEAGDYELRYVTSRSKTVLGRAPIVVTEAKATVSGPAEAILGTVVSVTWTGPNNDGDYITVVPKTTADGQYGKYVATAKGSPMTLAVPVDPGDAELRYMTGQGAKVLARSPIKIIKPEVAVHGPEQVVAGTVFEVIWFGPNNQADYVTIVPKDLPDGRYDNYTATAKGSPLKLTAPIEPGAAELRYMTGSGARVLARRAIQVNAAAITLDAPAEAVAGSAVKLTWTGPANRGDYLTIVPRDLPNGQYARYADTSKGSPVTVECPIAAGAMEIRYMSGQGAKVLARRPLLTTAPQVTFHVPDKAAAGSNVSIEWTGPNNPGDYLTIVQKSAKDGISLHTAPASRGSPSSLLAPKEAGPAEVRYMSGQSHQVLARAVLELTPTN